MIPLRDSVRTRTAPVVTVALIVVNVLVFLHEVALGPNLERFVLAYGLVPRRLVFWPGNPLDAARFAPLLTSMFWHGGWIHLAGNMLFLWIFGDAVEDRLGHGRYAFFYVATGVIAALTQVSLDPASLTPTIGASGAIAGVLGAYLLWYPRAKIVTFVPVFFLPWFVDIPAVVFLLLWFVAQLASALLTASAQAGGGVAWWAHVGGFIGGFVLGKVLAPPRRRVRRLDVTA